MCVCKELINTMSYSAVRETSVSLHHGGPIEGPPETPRTSQHYRVEGIKGVLPCVSVAPVFLPGLATLEVLP